MKTWEVEIMIRRRVRAESAVEAQEDVISDTVRDPGSIHRAGAVEVRSGPLTEPQ